MKPIELPTLGYFKNGNGYLGSAGLLRFQLENLLALPDKDARKSELVAVLWQGPFSRPYAQELGRETFPIDEEGLAALKAHLNAQAEAVNATPPFTPQETNAYYQEKKKAEQKDPQPA